jgi:nucleoside-diphosphate-sugar epimerase
VTDQPVAAVTGANGYVGTTVVNCLESEGFQVRRLVRNPQPGTQDYPYAIDTPVAPDVLDGIDALVHCAYDFSVTSRTDVWETNVFGTRSLFDQAVASGVRRTIFVSSMSAYPNSRQIYGRAKLASEIDAFARGVTVIRPGLIYGPGWGGMVGTLRKLTTLPVIPLVAPRSHQFTLHEDDLRQALVTLVNTETVPKRPLGLAHPDPVSFERLMRTIAALDGKRVRPFVRVPWPLVYWSVRALELGPISLPIRADSLLGLVRPAPSVPNAPDVKELGIDLRPFPA